jgi:O-antigen/teichoic acid export membrane protein
MKFFVIQIGGLVMFSSSNIILTHVINPSEVTVFNIARQYYSLPLMLFSIVLLPFWSAITEAYSNNELDWIKQTLTKLFYFGVFFCFALLVLFLLEDFVLYYWIKNQVEISLSVSLSIIILNICTILLAPYSHFINGVGKLNLSLYVVIFKTLVFLPIAILMTRILGSTGLIITLLIINVIPSSIIELLQFNRIINRNAQGIWNK